MAATKATLADLFFHLLIDAPPHMTVHGQMSAVRMVDAKPTANK
jgi:aminoglycoside N3'-acetyltransferase